MSRTLLLTCALAAGTLLTGCESLQRTDSFLGFITPYRIDIVQGNAITKEQASLIKPGLSKLQVRDILGTPLLTSVFHADRWEYVFTLKRQGVEPQARKLAERRNVECVVLDVAALYAGVEEDPRLF